MAHSHSVYDTDTRFIIDPITRAIKGNNIGENLMAEEKNDIGYTTRDYAEKCKEIAYELNIPFLDVYGESGISILNRASTISDKVHPTVKGYKKIEQLFLNYFLNNKRF